MYTLSINMWFQKLMKQFFFGIDQVVYNFISSLYDLLISIARTSILTQADILDMADRIYKLLAIFMIFKVTFSLITYVVNPDDFSDKSKGISKLSMNIVISLGLLILTPYIFNMAYRLQTIILEDNTLAALIFDTSTEKAKETSGDFINSAGDKMAFITMSAFLTPNTSFDELQYCIQLKGTDGKFNPACSGIDNTNYARCTSQTCSEVNVSSSLLGLIDQDEDESNFSKQTLQNYVAGVNNESLGLMFRQEIVVATNDKNELFIMDYKYILSTVVGVVVVLLLLSFCMDVGLRSIKLAFLQLIAPIPILSYVDPKSGKDGMFKKWYQMCFKTYLSLFIRLLALYFAIYIISRVDSMVDIVDGSYQSNVYVKIFVIVGALMFAKDFPKILEGLGIKLDGGGKFTLNPLKKLEGSALGGKNITGAAAGAVTGFLGNKGARRFTGMLGGLGRGALEGKGTKEAQKRQADVNRKLRQARYNGKTFFGTMNERFGMETGAETGSEIFERKTKEAEAANKFHSANLQYAKGVRSHILEELQNKSSGELKDDVWRRAQTTLYNAQADFDRAIANGEDTSAARERLNAAKKSVVDDVLSGATEDGYMKAEREKYNIRISNNANLAKQAGLTAVGERPNADQIEKIKTNSQKGVNETDMELYKYRESDEASRHQGDKQAAEAKKIDVHFE